MMKVPPEIAVCIKEYIGYDHPSEMRTRYWRALCIEPRDFRDCLGLSLVDFDFHLLDLFNGTEEELELPAAWLGECLQHLRVLRSSALSERGIVCLLTRCASTLERIEINAFHHNSVSKFLPVLERLDGKEPDSASERRPRRQSDDYRYHHQRRLSSSSSSDSSAEKHAAQLRTSTSDGVMDQNNKLSREGNEGRQREGWLEGTLQAPNKVPLAFPNLRKIVFPEIQYLYFHQLIALLRADCSPKLEEVRLSIRDWLLLKSLERDLGPEGWQRISRRIGTIQLLGTDPVGASKWDQLERCLRGNLVHSLTVSLLRGIHVLKRLAALAKKYTLQSIYIHTLVVGPGEPQHATPPSTTIKLVVHEQSHQDDDARAP